MPTTEDYVASAILANASAWVAFFGLNEAPYLLIIFLYIVGAVLAGFLVARKAGGEVFWKVGLKSGFGAFVLHMFFFTAIEIVMNVILWTLEFHVTVLSVFLLGGVSGALLFSLVRRGGVVKSG